MIQDHPIDAGLLHQSAPMPPAVVCRCATCGGYWLGIGLRKLCNEWIFTCPVCGLTTGYVLER